MIIITMTSFLIISPKHAIHKTHSMSRASSKWLILPVCVVWYVCGCGGVCLGACVCVCACMCTLAVVNSTGLAELLRISTGKCLAVEIGESDSTGQGSLISSSYCSKRYSNSTLPVIDHNTVTSLV